MYSEGYVCFLFVLVEDFKFLLTCSDGIYRTSGMSRFYIS